MRLSQILERNNNNFDLVRLLAASLVVWNHSFALSGNYDEPITQFLKVVEPGALGVAIFFLISGLLVTNSLLRSQSPLSFISGRFFRIFPAYFVLLIMVVFVIGPLSTSVELSEYFGNQLTRKFLLRNIVFDIQYCLPGLWENHPNGAIDASLWSLPLEIGCYLTLLSLFIIQRQSKIKYQILWLAVFVVVLIPKAVLLEHVFGVGYSIIDNRYLLCFLIGSLMAINKEKIDLNGSLVIGLFLLCFVTWRYSNIIQFLFPISVSIFLVFLASSELFVRIPHHHDISYGMYIWHCIIMQLLYSWFRIDSASLMFVAAFAVTVPVAYLSCRVVEEPSMRFGKRCMNQFEKKKRGSDNTLILVVLIIIIIMGSKVIM